MAVITWKSDEELLAEAKNGKQDGILRAYQSAMEGGFTSSALGSPHAYASDALSQIKLIGAAAADDSVEYECQNVATGEYVMPLHTAAQIKQVLRDGKNQAVAYKKRLNSLLGQLEAATTVEEVNGITWE